MTVCTLLMLVHVIMCNSRMQIELIKKICIGIGIGISIDAIAAGRPHSIALSAQQQ